MRAKGSPSTYRFLRSSVDCLMGRLKVEGVVTGVIALKKGYKYSVLNKKNAERYQDGNLHYKASTDNAHILRNRKQA